MENSINERLKAVRITLKLNQRDFSKNIFLRQGSYARIEQGKIQLNERIIELVCSKYNVNKAYLKDGKKPMFCGNPPDVKLGQLNQIFEELNGLFQDYLIIQAKELLRVQTQQGGGETKTEVLKRTRKC
jgi:transcriptional regulator with XRE-family HTH domain